MVGKKLDPLGSLSSHSSKKSSHGKDEFMSVTVRKDHPKEKAGIRLEAEENGRIRVVNIATNGLFAGSEVEIGDIVLSVNGKRLARGEGPESLVEVIANAQSKVTMVVKKTSTQPRVAEKQPKDKDKICDNNVAKEDTYYAGQSKHKEDGSIAFHSKQEVEERKKKSKTVSTTISANKEDGITEDIDDTAGLVFIVRNKLLYVADIDASSCFVNSKLDVGDRVLSINDCNFRSYADAALASKMVVKAKNAVTIVVEKNTAGLGDVNEKEIQRNRENARSKSRDRKTRRSSSASKRSSKKEDSKVLRRKVKSSAASASELSTDDSTATLSIATSGADDDDQDSFGGDDLIVDLPLSTKNYREIVIAAPKKFSSQEVGVLFETLKNRHVTVKKIEEGSIFANTSLKVGDIVLEINDTDYRNKPDKNHAWRTCRETKETVTMLIRKEEIKFKQQEFNLDASATNLEWQ